MTMFVFQDQARFMKLCGQSTEQYNDKQVALYAKLIDEETNGELLPHVGELLYVTEREMEPKQKPTAEQVVGAVDGALDAIVVAIGLLRSLGLDPQPLWNIVTLNNLSKVNPQTGTVLKRADGKVLKPETWKDPRPQLVFEIKRQYDAQS